MLTAERTRALLRSGRFSPLAGGSECAAERARKQPANPAASMILRASEPWSPAGHELWGSQHRSFAVELLKIGYRLRTRYGGALFDTWLGDVMPRAVVWPADDDDY